MSILELGQWGRFQLAGIEGRGSMATVYRAEDPQRDGHVALKVLRTKYIGDLAAVKKFVDEAMRAALVDHPNVVAVHEVGQHEGRPFLVTEFVAGETLKARLDRGRLSERECLSLLRQVCSGLIAVHECGVIHGDLKPENIMLATDEARFGIRIADEAAPFTAKIADFGIARLAAKTSAAAARKSSSGPRRPRSGTPHWMAPELTIGDGPTLRSDIYSLGVIAWEACTGRQLHPDCTTALDYAQAREASEPPPLHKLPETAGLSREFAIVVAKMLALDPTDRYDPEGLLRDVGRLTSEEREHAITFAKNDPSSAFASRRRPVAKSGSIRSRKSSSGLHKKGRPSGPVRASSTLRASGSHKRSRQVARKPAKVPAKGPPSDPGDKSGPVVAPRKRPLSRRFR